MAETQASLLKQSPFWQVLPVVVLYLHIFLSCRVLSSQYNYKVQKRKKSSLIAQQAAEALLEVT